MGENMFRANIIPGQGFKEFLIYKEIPNIRSNGTVGTASYKSKEQSIYGLITCADPKEKEEWAQKRHPVTHRIIQYGAMVKAEPTDVLVLNDGRCFYIRGINNPGNLELTVIYEVEERNEVYELIKSLGGEKAKNIERDKAART